MGIFEKLIFKIQARVSHWPKIFQQILGVILFVAIMWFFLFIGSFFGPSGSYHNTPFLYD